MWRSSRGSRRRGEPDELAPARLERQLEAGAARRARRSRRPRRARPRPPRPRAVAEPDAARPAAAHGDRLDLAARPHVGAGRAPPRAPARARSRAGRTAGRRGSSAAPSSVAGQRAARARAPASGSSSSHSHARGAQALDARGLGRPRAGVAGGRSARPCGGSAPRRRAAPRSRRRPRSPASVRSSSGPGVLVGARARCPRRARSCRPRPRRGRASVDRARRARASSRARRGADDPGADDDDVGRGGLTRREAGRERVARVEQVLAHPGDPRAAGDLGDDRGPPADLGLRRRAGR